MAFPDAAAVGPTEGKSSNALKRLIFYIEATRTAGTGTYSNMDANAQEQLRPLPMAKVAAALVDTTEVLAREIALPSAELPEWDDFEWRIARAVATMQGISSLLSVGLRWQGPQSWRRFLDEQRNHVAARHRCIERLLQRIDEGARHREIPIVALKGTALHRLGVYQAGERPMADIDLLVHSSDANATTRLLEECDYKVTFRTWRHDLFESRFTKISNVATFGESADNPIKIELHTSIQERLPVSVTEITQFIFPSPEVAGLNAYASMASLMLHLLLHAAGNIRAHALRCIQLHDIAQLARRFGTSDWNELLTARPNDQGLWWAVAPLVLTARYYPTVVPGFVIEYASAECSWLLRKRSRQYSLADVSWSNVRIYAFPGIEWARTPREALSFMIGRVWPSRETRNELERFDANYPGATGVAWYGISQTARALRWAVGRAPRVQTILPVRAALAQREDDVGCSGESLARSTAALHS